MTNMFLIVHKADKVCR